MKKILLLTCTLVLALTASAQEFRFAVISDTHIGKPDAARTLRQVVRAINRDQEIRFVLHLGDVSDNGLRNEYRKARRILSRLKRPLYVTTGNHDAKQPERYANFRRTFGSGEFHFECDGIRFIGLTTGPFEANRHATLPDDEVAWLAEASRDTLPTVIAAHHTPDLVAHREAIFPRIDPSHIVLWLAGHLHCNKTSPTVPGPSAVCTSTLGHGSYNIVEVSGNELRIVLTAPGDSSRTIWHTQTVK